MTHLMSGAHVQFHLHNTYIIIYYLISKTPKRLEHQKNEDDPRNPNNLEICRYAAENWPHIVCVLKLPEIGVSHKA